MYASAYEIFTGFLCEKHYISRTLRGWPGYASFFYILAITFLLQCNFIF